MKTTIRTQRKQLLNGLCYTLVFVLLFASCDGPSGPPKPVDPCEGRKTPFKASFHISEGSQVLDTLVQGDTILNTNAAVFIADGNYTSYEWQVGFDDRTWREKQFSLRFPSMVGKFTVRLIARDTNWAKCVAGDDGIDTVYRILVVVGEAQARIYGSYRGATKENPQDSFTVDIRRYRRYYTFPPYEGVIEDQAWRVIINNLPKGSWEPDTLLDKTSTVESIRADITYRGIDFDARDHFGSGSQNVKGRATLSADGQTLTAEYNLRKWSETKPYYRILTPQTFIGKRIQ